MSSSSSRATSRMQSRARVDMLVFVCAWCRAGVDRRVYHTPRNQNHPFYVNGLICLAFMHVTCFFLWIDALAKTLMNELQEEHEEWLHMPSQTAGEGCTDRELAIELRMLKKKVRKLEDQAHVPIPICNYFWEFVGMAIALGVMLKLYGKA
ncbi:hypothetical protein VPH35_129443 [Triticum aestivum]